MWLWSRLMGDTTSKRFRIRVWPEGPLAFPDELWHVCGPWTLTPACAIAPVDEGHPMDVREGAGAWEAGLPADSRPLGKDFDFGEIYLTLRALDLDDEQQILDWVNRYGPMGLCWRQHPVSAEQVYRSPDDAFLTTYDLGPDSPTLDEMVRLGAARDRAVAETGETYPEAVVETLEEFRFTARLLRDLTRSWQLLQQAAEPPAEDEFWDDWVEGQPRLTFESEWLSRALNGSLGSDFDWDTSRAHAASAIESFLEPFLTPFYPRLRMVEPGYPMDLRPIQANIPLHNVLGLELYNHIAEAQPYKTCENETCGRLFVRQSGRAEHGQNRLRGVRYCSADCARAQARRAYRRRQRDN